MCELEARPGNHTSLFPLVSTPEVENFVEVMEMLKSLFEGQDRNNTFMKRRASRTHGLKCTGV